MARYEGREQAMRELLANLQGMVPDLNGEGLNFRRAEANEKPLNHGQRRLIARALARGDSDEQMREVLSSW